MSVAGSSVPLLCPSSSVSWLIEKTGQSLPELSEMASVAGCSVPAKAISKFAASRAAVSSAFGDSAPAASGDGFLHISSSAALSRTSYRSRTSGETISKVASTIASSGLVEPGNSARDAPVYEVALLFSAGFAVRGEAAEVAAKAACVVPAISAGFAVPDAAEVAVAGFVEPEPAIELSFLDNKQRRSGF